VSNLSIKRLQVGNSTAGNNFVIRQPDAADATLRISNGNIGTTTDLVTVNSSGSVGIGTASPSSKLHLYESGASNVIFTMTPANGNNDALINMTGQDGNIATEGFQIQYRNAVGDAILKQTFTGLTGATAALKFSTANAADAMTIAGAGYVRMQYQPHFRAYASYTIPYAPGGSGVIVFNVIQNNVGGGYNTTNGRFTAPIAGVYQFDYHLLGTNDATDGDVRVWKNGANLFMASYGGTYTGYKPVDVHFSILLAAGDYIELRNLGGATWHTDGSYHCWASCGYLG
jgi:hypothetical protein